jgi:hypothetical protein
MLIAYNLWVLNFNVEFLYCSSMFRLLLSKHHQDVYRECIKEMFVVFLGKKFKRHLSWDKTFVVWTSPLNSNTHPAVLLSCCVCYRQQCTAALRCDRMTVKYTHGDMLLILGTCNSLVLVPVLVLVLVPVLDNTRTLMRFNSCSSVCVRQELSIAMELVNARRSRTVLTAANGGDIFAAVGWVPLSSRCLA